MVNLRRDTLSVGYDSIWTVLPNGEELLLDVIPTGHPITAEMDQAYADHVADRMKGSPTR